MFGIGNEDASTVVSGAPPPDEGEIQGGKTQPGQPFLYGLHLGSPMGKRFSTNSDMGDIPHFLVFLTSHQIREAHMVPEKWRTASNPQATMASAPCLAFKVTVTTKIGQLLTWRPRV